MRHRYGTFGGQLKATLPVRRRRRLTLTEAALLTQRYGRRSWQTLATIAGTSASDVRRAVLQAEHGAPAAPTEAPGAHRRRSTRHAPPVLRAATVNVAEAAHELGLTTPALHEWLIAKRWIRQDRSGTVVAGATKLTAGLLNQPVRHEEVGRRGCRLHYGSIRFTTRGMNHLRAEFASRSAAQ